MERGSPSTCRSRTNKTNPAGAEAWKWPYECGGKPVNLPTMYTPPHHRQDDPAALSAFMQAFPFAALVSDGERGLAATHIPLILTESCDSLVLLGHMAKANPQWRDLAGGNEVMAIFSEPHAYISPANYEPGRWVPTWNYVAVHAYGKPAVVEEREAKLPFSMRPSGLLSLPTRRSSMHIPTTSWTRSSKASSLSRSRLAALRGAGS